MDVRRILFVSLPVMLALTVVGLMTLGSESQAQAEQVRICHRTNAATNGYVSIMVSEAAVDGNPNTDPGPGEADHLEHTGPIYDPENPPPPPRNEDQWGTSFRPSANLTD